MVEDTKREKLLAQEEFNQAIKDSETFVKRPTINEDIIEEEMKQEEIIEEVRVAREGEDRIQNLEEVLDIKSQLICMICSELQLPGRLPVFCTSCETATFCNDCIGQWKKKNNTCPQCRQPNFQMRPLSESKTLKTLGDLAMIYCQNSHKGCTFTAPLSEIESHEHYCGNCQSCDDFVFGMDIIKHQLVCKGQKIQCYFCKLNGTREDILNHRCYQMFTVPSQQNYYISQKRIQNMSDIAKFIDILSCSICNNLLRRARCCTKCETHYCDLCISTDPDGCIECDDRNPNLKEANRNIQNLLNRVIVSCNRCQKDFKYDQLDEHELSCAIDQCQICKSKFDGSSLIHHMVYDCKLANFKCQICNQQYQRGRFAAHNCSQATASQDPSNPAQFNNRSSVIIWDSVDEHWVQKKKGFYCLGIGYWLTNFGKKFRKNSQYRAKAYMSILLVVITWAEMIKTTLLYYNKDYDFVCPLIYFWSFAFPLWFFSLVSMTYNSTTWSGYRGSSWFFKFVQSLVLITIGTILNAFFLMEIGFRQEGYLQQDEKKEPTSGQIGYATCSRDKYRGYTRKTIGARFLLTTFGLISCCCQVIRISLTMAQLADHHKLHHAKYVLVMSLTANLLCIFKVLLSPCCIEKEQIQKGYSRVPKA